MRSKLLSVVALALPVIMAATSANAISLVRLNDGVSPTLTVLDNGVGDTNAIFGVLVLNQAYGNWAINVVTGLTKPALGDADDPHMDLGFVNVSNLLAPGAAETLKIEFTDNNFQDLSLSMLQQFVANWGGTTQGNVVANIWADASNTLFGQGINLTNLGPFGPGAFAASDSLDFLNDGTTYSLTIELDISHDGDQGDTTSGNLELRHIPEPGTLALFGLGLVGLGFARRRKAA